MTFASEMTSALSLLGLRIELVGLFGGLAFAGVGAFTQIRVTRQLYADGFLKLAPTIAWTAATALIVTLLAGSMVAVVTTLCVLFAFNAAAGIKRSIARDAALREAKWKAEEPFWRVLWAQQNAQLAIEKARRTYYPKSTRKAERIS